jgi:hypothetical protein
MADGTLTLELHGEVTLAAFADAIEHWRGLIDAITREVSDREITWVISDLAPGSATVTARAIAAHDVVAPVAEAYTEVGRALSKHMIETLAPRVRDEARALSAVISQSVDYMRFETSEFDTVITYNYDELLKQAAAAERVEMPAALGGVQGRIQTLTNRGGLRFTLYDTLYDKAVGCYLAEGQEEIMRDLWGQLAVVEGLVTRDTLNGRPLAVRHIWNVSGVREVRPDAFFAARGVVARQANDPREPETLITAGRDA